MKKLFLLSGLILSVSLIFAQPKQQIKDGGFEKWKEYPAERGKYWDLEVEKTDMLRTLNSLYALEVQEFRTELTSFRDTTSPHGGKCALRMESVSFQNVLFVPGAIGTVPENFAALYIKDKGFELSADFESKPLRLTGYYKYAPVNNDSAAIEIELTNYGEFTIASALWKEKETVSDWKEFDIEIKYTVHEYMDVTDLKLVFAASAGYNFKKLETCKGQVGSKFWIDDIAFEYGNGLKEPLMERTHSKAYPNPATTTVNISFDKVLKGNLIIYNMLGAEITTQPVNGNSVEANITHLATGSYFYRVIEGNLIRTSGKFLVE